MILPIRTSIQPRRTPYANYAMIILNVAVFLLTYHPHISLFTGRPEYLHDWANKFILNPEPEQLHYWQFVSYAFLHASFMHIFGNMFFLYLFGNNINDKLGHIGYTVFYLLGGIFSGIGHTWVSDAPVLGASGAVAAVTGAYLVLFPQTLITVIYWLFFIGTVEVPALYFIAFKLIIWDNVISPSFGPPISIAHGAHLAGYTFGIVTVVALLAMHILSGSSYDMWAMIKRWNRRRKYRDIVSSGYDPFMGRSKVRGVTAKQVNKSPAEKQKEEQIMQLRSDISNRIMQRNLPAAAEAYTELMELDSEQVLPGKQLLDIANQLTGESKHAESARAYEQFLSHYGTYEYVEQVELMLGIIYARYLNQPDLAVKHLEIAEKKLTDPGQLKMCREELARLKKA